MTIQEMTTNFDLLAHAYYFSAIAYVLFLFCCHLIDVFQTLKADYKSKLVVADLAPSQAPLALPPSNQSTLRELRDHNLQAQVKLVTGLSVSYCSRSQLLSALA